MTIREILDANRNALNRLKHSAMRVAHGTEGPLAAFYRDVAVAADGAAAAIELVCEKATDIDVEIVDEIGTTPEGVSVVEVKAAREPEPEVIS